MTSSKVDDGASQPTFPPTDFRDFIDAVLKSNTESGNFIQHYTLPSFRSDRLRETQMQFAQHGIIAIDELMRQRCDIDAHYGWVLASDAELVYRSMGGKNEGGTVWARQWMRGIFHEYERLNKGLFDTKQGLETVMRNADSGQQ